MTNKEARPVPKPPLRRAPWWRLLAGDLPIRTVSPAWTTNRFITYRAAPPGWKPASGDCGPSRDYV
ncbi:MAG: hypothetical protein WBX25_03225 [Rhodomicrobium sp.]